MSDKLKPFPGSNVTIEKMAAILRERLNIKPDTRIAATGDLVDLVKRLGGKIHVKESPEVFETQGGSLVIHGLRSFTIYLSPYTSPLRDNFTIAHEVGHYILHYIWHRESFSEADMPLIFTRYGTGNLEWQANRFAAGLLMPRKPFTEDFNQLQDIELLAGRYGVSLPAAEIRCDSLGLKLSDPVEAN